MQLIYPTVIAFRQLCNAQYKRGDVKRLPVKSNLTFKGSLLLMGNTPICSVWPDKVTLYPTLNRSPLMREFKTEIKNYFNKYLPKVTVEESPHAFV